MGHGLPVITSRYNGVAELITDGVNGFVVENPLDDKEIADAIRPLIDPGQRRQVGERAAETASAHTMQRNVRETLEVIRRAAPRQAAPESHRNRPT